MNWRLWLRARACWGGDRRGRSPGAAQRSEFIPAARSALPVRMRDRASATCANLEIRGAVYASRARIQNVFAPDFGAQRFQNAAGRTAPPPACRRLGEHGRRSPASGRTGSSSRSRSAVRWRSPNCRLRARLRYRFSLIDSDGVLLSIPPRVRFRLPVLSGVTEEQTEADRRRARESHAASAGRSRSAGERHLRDQCRQHAGHARDY